MKKLLGILTIILFAGCNSEDAPGCFKKAGEIVQDEVAIDHFNEIIVYERVKLFIQQGPVQKVIIETGKNLRQDISVEVIDNRLSIRNENSCNLVREYELTKVYVTIPDLTWLQNSSGSSIESIGTLKLNDLYLLSVNQENDLSIHTDGDFILDLDVENLKITNDNVSNYFLTGKAENFNVFFAAGDGRLDAPGLIVKNYQIFHRGTNKMIVFPVESIKGELRSSGNVIAKNRPAVVNVESYYTGRLIFE